MLSFWSIQKCTETAGRWNGERKSKVAKEEGETGGYGWIPMNQLAFGCGTPFARYAMTHFSVSAYTCKNVSYP